MPKEYKHISGLKDIVEVNFQDNTNSKSEYPFICPITLKEFNGLNKFTLIWSCGCAVMEKAITETQEGQSGECISCGQKFSKKDLVSLNMTPDE